MLVETSVAKSMANSLDFTAKLYIEDKDKLWTHPISLSASKCLLLSPVEIDIATF